MRVGIDSYVFFPENFLINELSFELRQKGHEVFVSTGLPNYETKILRKGYSFFGPYKEEVRGIHIYRYPIFPRGQGLARLALNYFSNLIFGILNLFRVPRTDVSFVFGGSPISIAIPAVIRKLIFGTPLAIWLQDPWPETFAAVTGISSKSFLYRSLSNLVRYIYSNTDLLLIQSESYRDHLKLHDYRGRVELLPNWAPEMTSTCAYKPTWLSTLPKDRFILTFAGNVGKGQALDDLIKALPQVLKLSSLTLAIVGDGTELKSLEKLVKELKLDDHVLFFGRRPLEDMPELFKASSALYVSLRGNHLSFLTIPSKLQAYMMSGTAVMASLKGEGARIIRESQSGLVCDPGNQSALANTLDDLISLPAAELSDMGKRAKEYAKTHFNRSNLISKIEMSLMEIAQ